MFKVGDKVVRNKDSRGSWWTVKCKSVGLTPDTQLTVTWYGNGSIEFKEVAGICVADAFELITDWENASEIDLIKNIGYSKHYRD